MNLKNEIDKKISRRRFAKNITAAIGTSGMLLMGGVSPRNQTIAAGGIKKRRLGKTGMMVAELSIGGHVNGPKSKENRATDQEVRNEVVKRAYDLGINYFDMNNNKTEHEILGVALEKHAIRDKVYLVEACRVNYEATPEESKKAVIQSVLNNLPILRTDYVDVLRLTSVIEEFKPDHIRSYVEAGEELKQKGKIKHIAIATHFPAFVMRILNEFPQVEIIYTPYNFMLQGAAAEAFPLARKKDVGIVVIKPFNKGSLFNPGPFGEAQIADRIKQENRNLNDLPRHGNESVAAANLRYILANKNVSCIVPGMETVAEVEQNVAAATGTLTTTDLRILEELKNSGRPLWAADYSWMEHWTHRA